MSKAYRIRRYMDLIQPSNYGYEPFTSLYCRTRPNGILMPRGLGIVVRFCSGTRMPEVPVKGEWKIAFTQFSLPSWLGGRRLDNWPDQSCNWDHAANREISHVPAFHSILLKVVMFLLAGAGFGAYLGRSGWKDVSEAFLDA